MKSLIVKNVVLHNGTGRAVKVDIYIEGGTIKKIGKRLNVKAQDMIDGGGGKAILPGLINSHCHAAMILFRGYADDEPLESWLKNKIWPLEAKLTEETVYWGTKLACLEMIKNGVTAFGDMYFHHKAAAEAVDAMGQRSVLAFVFFDFFNRQKLQDAIREIHKFFDSLPKFSSRIGWSLGPHSIYTVSTEGLRFAADFARKHKVPVQIHLSETKNEVDFSLKKFQKRPVEYLNAIGFLGKNVLAAHSIWFSSGEAAIFARSGATAVYCPVSNLKLSSGVFDYGLARKHKISVALGTDGPASNNSLNMIADLKTGILLQKLKNAASMPTSEAFNVMSFNPAKFFNLNYGIKENGTADFILLDLTQLPFCPGHNFFSDLFYSASGNCVTDVIVNGRIIMRNRKVKGEEEIMRKAKSLSKQIVAKS